jgi:hypothetical protein
VVDVRNLANLYKNSFIVITPAVKSEADKVSEQDNKLLNASVEISTIYTFCFDIKYRCHINEQSIIYNIR